MPREWQKEPIIQGFDSTTQGITELIELYDHLENDKEISRRNVNNNTKRKKPKQSSELHQYAKSSQRKVSQQ